MQLVNCAVKGALWVTVKQAWHAEDVSEPQVNCSMMSVEPLGPLMAYADESAVTVPLPQWKNASTPPEGESIPKVAEKEQSVATAAVAICAGSVPGRVCTVTCWPGVQPSSWPEIWRV
ncbi:MAG: hypothetical protein IPL81_03715 [Flavobacteriales bacterium]|nr:hypothetical protein [Flavobacteriales bacterium]